jgi:glucokinase-like ROK family protein
MDGSPPGYVTHEIFQSIRLISILLMEKDFYHEIQILEMSKMITVLDTYKKSDQSFLRMYNKSKVLNILRNQGSMSRVDLAGVSKLDKKTITNIVNDLFEENQIYVEHTSREGSGRPKEILSLNGDFCRCIGIDLGGTHISGVILDFAGKILAEENIETRSTLDKDVMLDMCDFVIKQLLKKTGLAISDINAMGLSIPGNADQSTGVVVYAENTPKWIGMPMKQIFEEKYNIPIYIEDCSRLMAMAELCYGKGRDCDNFIVIDLGHGIGCGIIVGRELFFGASGKAGEIGHTIVKVDGPLCTCGRNGCIESLASGWAISRMAKDVSDANENSILRKISKQGEEPNNQDVIIAAEMGDENCIRILREAGTYIGIGIANAVSFFNPAKIIIGGRLIRNNEILLNELVKTVKIKTLQQLYSEDLITVSEIGVFASAMGAATLCLNQYYN